MKKTQIILAVLGGVATLVVIALVVMWVADTTPIHSVKEDTRSLYITLLRDRAIVDVSVILSPKHVHLDVRYDVGIVRHVDIPTHGKDVVVKPFLLRTTLLHQDHLVDSTGRRWNWMMQNPLKEPFPTGTLHGFAVLYSPTENRKGECQFFWQEPEGTTRGAWSRR